MPPALTVDVVVPTRNRARYLEACLRSVREQTMPANRVFVVDDGSTDESPALLARLAKDWDGLTVISTPPRGVSAARNAAIAASSADLIAFIDSDDLWDSDKLERQVALFASARPEVSLVYCGYRRIDAEGGALALPVVVADMRGNGFRDMLERFKGIAPSTMVVRRQALLDVGGFDTTLVQGEDRDVCLKLARISDFDCVTGPLASFRIHGDSAYERAMREDRRFVLMQRLQVWNRWTTAIDDWNAVLKRFRREAVAAVSPAAFLWPGTGLYHRLHTSELDLARRLFPSPLHYFATLLSTQGRQLALAARTAASRLVRRTRPPATGSREVTAVVLTLDEASTEDAIASIRRQTVPISDIVVIRGVRPFHRALNEGAARVTTPFFVQVDADMILDDTCVETLLGLMDSRTGVAVARLRDALVGDVVGIKLFRTACFAVATLRDTVSPDTRFADDLSQAGWQTRRLDATVTLGEHRPAYEPAYTYRKHLMEGQRYRDRDSIGGFTAHLARLEQSPHPMALIAQVGLARGFFREDDYDPLGLGAGDDEFVRLEPLLTAAEPPAAFSAPAPGRSPLDTAFADWLRLGRATFEAADGDRLRFHMRQLDSDPDGLATWPLKLAFCRGLLASGSDGDIEADLALLMRHLPMSSGRAQPGSPTKLDSIFDYAAARDLSQFTLATSSGGEYRRAPGGAGYVRTDASVATRTDANGRPRIRVPARPFGHVIAPNTQRLEGLGWSLDLLKAGYAVVHTPTVTGTEARSLPLLVAQRLLERSGVHRIFQPSQTDASFDYSSLVEPHPPRYDMVRNRVLVVTQDLGRGGSERQMVAIIDGLVKRGFSVNVLSLTALEPGRPTYRAEIAAMGVSVDEAEEDGAGPDGQVPAGIGGESLRRMPSWLTGRVAPIIAAIRRHRPEIIDTRLDFAGIAAGFAGSVMGVPRVLIHQGSMSIARRNHPATQALRLAYRALATNPAITIVNNSEAGARDNEAWIGLPKGRISVLYNGFAPASSRTPEAAEVAELRRTLNVPPGAPVVGTVIRFVKEKDPRLWIDTAAAIAAVRADVRFLVFGYGALEPEMHARIAHHRLQDRVVIAGPTTDVGLAYSAMDVMLLTSAIEGLPNVMIEAEAIGRPVVATDVGGNREGIIQDVTGTIVQSRSPEELAAAVLSWLDAPARRARAETEGPRFVADRFGVDRMVDEMVRHYRGDGQG